MRLNELLGPAAGYARGLGAQFGIEEQEGVPTLAPELVPTSDIHARPEQWALHGGTLLWAHVPAMGSAGAGNVNQIRILPGSDELLIIEGIFMNTGQVNDVHYGIDDVDSGEVSTGNIVARDARRITTTGGAAASGTRMFTDSIGSGSFSTLTGRVNGGYVEPFWLPLDVVLVRPWRFVFANTTDSAAIAVGHSIRCRARPATPRELAIGSI